MTKDPKINPKQRSYDNDWREQQQRFAERVERRARIEREERWREQR